MKVNDQIIDLQKSISLFDYLEQNNFDISRIAVEINGNIITRAKYKDTILNKEDAIEIVSFVGGG